MTTLICENCAIGPCEWKCENLSGKQTRYDCPVSAIELSAKWERVKISVLDGRDVLPIGKKSDFDKRIDKAIKLVDWSSLSTVPPRKFFGFTILEWCYVVACVIILFIIICVDMVII